MPTQISYVSLYVLFNGLHVQTNDCIELLDPVIRHKIYRNFSHGFTINTGCKAVRRELMQLFFLVMQHLDPHQVPVRKGLILLTIYHGEPDVLAMASLLSCKQKGLSRGFRER